MIGHQFEVDEAPLVKIGIRSGHVRVEAGEEGVVRIEVDTQDPTFEVRQIGDAIVAGGERSIRTHVSVYVPAQAAMEISTASADVEVGPALKRLEVKTASGEVSFDSARRLQVRTASGNVLGNRVEGEANCTTASGDVRISDLSGRADLSTASGDIMVDRCTGSITCATVSGDIGIHVMSGPSINVRSTSGQVRVGILSRTRLDLDANSLSGRITLPSPSPGSEAPEREISARIRLVSGDLRIERRG